MKWLKSKERGQAIMIVALMMVVLLGFIGLAVDGGELYLAQRRSRNAADAAMIAATYELCKTGNPGDASALAVRAAGENAALENGFDAANADQDVIIRVGGTDTLETTGLPADTINQYVEAEIWQDSPTYLIQLVYPGPTEVTAMAVGRCQPETNASAGFAVCLTDPSPTDGKGLEIGSNGGEITICYGDLGVNSTIQFANGQTTVSCDPVTCYEHVPASFNPSDCSADIVVPGGTGGITNASGGSYASDTVQDGSCADDLSDLPTPGACDYTHTGTIGGTDNIDIDDENPSGNPDFVYCVPGGLVANNTGDLIELDGPGIFKFSGNWTQNNGIIRVTDAMVYLDGVDFDASGGTLYMRAMKPETYTNELYAGMVLFSSPGNTNDIRFTAGNSKTIFGTVYAPDALISMEGGADDLLVAQLIAAELNLGGNSAFRLYYDSDWFFTFPPELKIGS